MNFCCCFDIIKNLTRVRTLFYLIFIQLLLTGCIGIRYLQKGEYLIYQQKIKGNEETSKEKLAAFYKQKPNKKIPLLNISPYVYLFQWGLKTYDADKLEQNKVEVSEKFDIRIARFDESKQKKINKLQRKKAKKLDKIDRDINEGNLLMRMGEPLAIYDTILSTASLDQMKTYLNTQGYFNARTSLDMKRVGRRLQLVYRIDEGQPHLIDTIILNTGDKKIDSILIANESESLLQVGDRYNQDNLNEERNRIENLLQDNGYYAFSRQYINYRVDTSLGDYKSRIDLVVLKPSRNASHKQFKIDSIIFTTDVRSPTSNFKRFHKTYNGITYKYIKDNYSNKILDRRVFLHPKELYSRKNTLETQRQLINLDNFKFVNINFDTTDGKFVSNIFTSPLQKYQMTNEVGVNVTQGFPGPFYNLTLKTRNIFKGLENLEISGRVGFEGVASATDPTQVYSSTEAGAALNLIFPQFMLPLSSSFKSRLGQFNPKTNLVSGFAYTNRPEYKRSSFNSYINYSWQKAQERFYNITVADVSFINSTIKDANYQAELDRLRERGNNFWRTFEPSLVLSSSFGVTLNNNQYNSYMSNSASFLKLQFEAGGTMLNFFDINYLLDSSRYELYKYLKLSTDFRKFATITPKSKIAFRVFIGAAKSYANNKILPYEKYFFSGGSNSIRAWRPRRLGPGSFLTADTLSTDGNGILLRYNDDFEQPGEIIFESNIELRTQLIGFLHSAVFVDIGNVWMITDDLDRPGANFRLNRFYKEFAIGAGIGARLDFTFLLVRFDVGAKIYNPALPEGYRWIKGLTADKKVIGRNPTTTIENLNPLIYNITIGYPF